MNHIDPTRTSDGETALSEGCAHCGSPLNHGEWHPVTTEPGAGDGKPRVHSFCDDGCKTTWIDGD